MLEDNTSQYCKLTALGVDTVSIYSCRYND